MKSSKILKISVVIVLLLICINFKSFTYNNTVDYNPNKNSPQPIRIYNQLRYSSSWNLSNIYINNWSDTANDYDWCNYVDGNYVIENATFTGEQFGKTGIFIENTTQKFIIRNCQINDGITLLKVNNGHIINNFITFGQYEWMIYPVGLYMRGCNNNVIESNIINDTYTYREKNTYALYVHESNNITLKNNFLSTNFSPRDVDSFGILVAGHHIEVINNTIWDIGTGIKLSGGSFCKTINNNVYSSLRGLSVRGENHIIANNTINSIKKKNFDCIGIDVWVSINSTFLYNSIQNQNDYGFYSQSSNYNIISNNTIEDSVKFGIYLDSSNHNLITGNRMTNVKGCIKEIDCIDNVFNNNICQRITIIFISGYFPWMILGILMISVSLLLKLKLKGKSITT